MRTRRVLTTMLLLAAFATGAILSGCPRRDDAEERVVCGDLAQKLCDKWFECWPVISAEWWNDQEECSAAVKATCANGDELYECDMDNDDLLDCDDNVEDSPCGSLPASCVDLIECGG